MATAAKKPAAVAAATAVVEETVKVVEEAKKVVEETITKTEAVTADLMKPLADVQEKLRLGTEKGIEQFRSHYATMKGNAEAATDKLEASVAAAHAGTREFNMKVLDLFRAQTNASFAHLQALFGAKTVSDALKLQQDFVKTQVETLQTNSKDLAELAKKVATDVVEPVKDSFVVPFKR